MLSGLCKSVQRVYVHWDSSRVATLLFSVLSAHTPFRLESLMYDDHVNGTSPHITPPSSPPSPSPPSFLPKIPIHTNFWPLKTSTAVCKHLSSHSWFARRRFYLSHHYRKFSQSISNGPITRWMSESPVSWRQIDLTSITWSLPFEYTCKMWMCEHTSFCCWIHSSEFISQLSSLTTWLQSCVGLISRNQSRSGSSGCTRPWRSCR